MGGTDRAHELGAFLAGIPFFASFDESTLVWLARQFEPVHAHAGDAIIAEGDPGDGLYVLLSGRLRVSVSAAGGEERVLHDLGRGAVIGEIALLSDRMRSATARAASRTSASCTPSRRLACPWTLSAGQASAR